MPTKTKRRDMRRLLIIVGVCAVLAALLLIVYFCSYKKTFVARIDSPDGGHALTVYALGSSVLSGEHRLLVCADGDKLFDYAIPGGELEPPTAAWSDEEHMVLSSPSGGETLHFHLTFEEERIAAGWYQTKADGAGETSRPPAKTLNVISSAVSFEGYTVPAWTEATA